MINFTLSINYKQLKSFKMSKTTQVAKPTQTKKAATAVPASKAKSLTEVNTANLKKVAKNVTPGDSALTKLKYHYPADCDTKEKRKAFRVKARSQAEKLQKGLDAAVKSKNEKDIKKARRAQDIFNGETYLPDYLAA